MRRQPGILLVLLCLYLLGFVGPAGAQEKPQDIQSLQEALAKDPQNAETYYRLGLAYEAQGNEAEALTALKKAVSLKPDYAEARATLADAYDRRGVRLAEQENWREAEASFQEAIRSNPEDMKAFYNLGVAYGSQGQWLEAAGAFQDALRRDPNNPEANYNLGITYLMMGRQARSPEESNAIRRQALEQYRRLVTLNDSLAGDLFYVISNPREGALPTMRGWQAPPKSRGRW